MTNTTNEYAAWDFGFTAVDEPDSTSSDVTPPPTVNTDDIIQPVLNRLNNLESHIEEVLNAIERLEQLSTPNLDTDEYKSLIERDIRDKLHKIEAMVMPLLTNLLKDADKKEYIKWPNRKPIIEAFIDKFLTITRS